MCVIKKPQAASETEPMTIPRNREKVLRVPLSGLHERMAWPAFSIECEPLVFLPTGHLDDGPKMVTKKDENGACDVVVRCLANTLIDPKRRNLASGVADGESAPKEPQGGIQLWL